MGIFRHEIIAEDIIRIKTIYNVDVLLILGNEKAALIDTGYGVGDLLSYVRKLTDLPLVVIGTHGHVDHMGGSGQFEQVYLSKKDWELAADHTQVSKRIEFAEALSGARPADEDMIPQRTDPYTDIEDGMMFDLGGITLETIMCPGHTQGCTCYLIREKRILILGDAGNSRSFLFFPEASGIEEYLQNLIHLNQRSGDFDSVLFFHDDNIGGKGVIEENIGLCREILRGTDDHEPMSLLGEDIFAAKKVDENWKRLDGGFANILYK